MIVVIVAVVGVVGIASAAKSSKRLSDDERGKQLYERSCIQCHGPGGAGDGPATAALVHPVPDLRGKIGTDDGTVEEMAQIVINGRGTMPGYEMSFDKYDARRVVRYLAKVSLDPSIKAAPPPKPAVPAKDTGKPAPSNEE